MSFPEHNGLQGLRVVVIERDSDTRHQATLTLRAAGYCVFAARDVASALALVHKYPALELLIARPHADDPDGIQLLRRAHQIHPRLPILYIHPASSAAVAAANVASLAEPFSSTQLVTSVAKLMGGRRGTKPRDRREQVFAGATG